MCNIAFVLIFKLPDGCNPIFKKGKEKEVGAFLKKKLQQIVKLYIREYDTSIFGLKTQYLPKDFVNNFHCPFSW